LLDGDEDMKCKLIDKTTSADNAKEVCSKKFCINNCRHGQYRKGKVTCLIESTDKFENAPIGDGNRPKGWIKRGRYIKDYKKDSKAKLNRRYGETTRRGKRLGMMNKSKLECTRNPRKVKDNDAK